MVKVKRLGHATISTSDIEAMVDYYSRILGFSVIERTKDHVYLGTKQGLETIELVKGEPNQLQRLSFQIAPGSDLGDVAKEFDAFSKDQVAKADAALTKKGLPKIGPEFKLKGEGG